MARDFDGVTDRIDWANIWDPGGRAQTIAFWAFTDDLATGQYYFMTHESAATGIGGVLVQTAGTERFGVNARHVTADTTRTSANNANESGKWLHWTVTYAGGTAATDIRIYKGGVETTYTDSNNGVGAARAGAGEHSIGGRIFDNNRNLDGRIAEPANWDRVLDVGEIAGLANRLSPLFYLRGLRFYPKWGMLRETPHNYITGETATLDGTTVIQHPPIILPAAPYIITAPAVAVVVPKLRVVRSGLVWAG